MSRARVSTNDYDKSRAPAQSALRSISAGSAACGGVAASALGGLCALVAAAAFSAGAVH